MRKKCICLVVLLTAFGASTQPTEAAQQTYSTPDQGKRICPPGYFCVGQIKKPCPAGTYNPNAGQATCLPCKLIKQCPTASIRPIETSPDTKPQMLTSKTIAPAGGVSPLPSVRCAPGFFCAEKYSWKRVKCGAGFVGTSLWNTNSQCDGLCPAGFYCPEGTSSPIPCFKDTRFFCPEGSFLPVNIESGRYVKNHREVITERGYWVNDMGVRMPCPAGYYGDALGETREKCAGMCKGGFYCPEASTSATEIQCSLDEFCPVGSSAPYKIQPGYYKSSDGSEEIACPIGFYCTGGMKFTCPDGTYNTGEIGLSSVEQCNICPGGYFCIGEIVTECGKVNTYCPKGNPYNPLPVAEGYYTVGDVGKFQSTRTVCSYSNSKCALFKYNSLYLPEPSVLDDKATRTKLNMCEPGHYCTLGERYECEPGRFGSAPGLSSAACNGVCKGGFYCPAGSTLPNQFECPEEHYCPPGSGNPFPVDPGFYVPQGKDQQIVCPPGYYCTKGIKHICPAGKYGDQSGLASPECSGLCPPGFFCPEGTISAKSSQCLSTTEYCPIGSKNPFKVSQGFFTNEERSWQYPCETGHYCQEGIRRPCPAGSYGDRSILTSPTCSGPCKAGHFCLEGATNSTQYKCEEAFGLTMDKQTFHSNNLMDTTCLVLMLKVYPEQFFEFSLLPERKERDPSLWNLAHAKKGQYQVYNSMEWVPESKAFRSRGNNNLEYMATGWQPGAGAKTMCMWKKFLTDDIYGLDGMQKMESSNDYFMIGTYWSFRDRIFVSSGNNRGGYANVRVRIEKNEWVFYCLSSGGIGSTSEAYIATPNFPLTKVWEQADNGADRGILATSPHLSMIYGRTSTGTTDRPMFHTPDRQAYSDALYGGILHWNAHLSSTEIANAYRVTSYFYPNDGSRQPAELQCGAYPSVEWEQGFEGRHIGPIPSIHFEKNAQGTYDPKASPLKLFQKEEFPVPFFPTTLQNSPRAIYCPVGSGLPKFADEGFYTDETSTSQTICEEGYYCTLGERFPCPAGTFGSSKGLSQVGCSGPCPAGHMCPEASISPMECPIGWFSVSGSAECTFCDLPDGAVPRCNTARKCCETGRPGPTILVGSA